MVEPCIDRRLAADQAADIAGYSKVILTARAAQLDDSEPWAHLALGFVAFVRRQTDVAAAEFRRALELNPNFAAAHGYLGWALAFDGQLEEATKHNSNKSLQQRSAFTAGHRIHVASLAQNGQIDEARETLARLKEMHSDLSIAWIKKTSLARLNPSPNSSRGCARLGCIKFDGGRRNQRSDIWGL